MRNDIRHKFNTNTGFTICLNKLYDTIYNYNITKNLNILSMCLGTIEISFIDRMLTISSHNLKWFSPTRNNKSSIIVCSTYSFWMCIIYLVFPIMLNKKQSFIYLCVIFRNRRKESDYFITLSAILIYYHGIICIMAQSVLQFVYHTC